MRTSTLNRWMPLLELSPSIYISARLCRPYDLCILNQTYDMAWPHVLLRSDSSFLCPHTPCIYKHGNLTCMHYIKGSIGLMSWSSNPNGVVGVSPTSGECDRRCRQCSGFPHWRSSPRHPGPRSGDCPPRRSSRRVGGVNRGAGLDWAWPPRHGGWLPEWRWPQGTWGLDRRFHYSSGGHRGHHNYSGCGKQSLRLDCT